MKTRQGFIQLPLLVGVVLALFVSGGIGYYSIQKKTEKKLLKTDSQDFEMFKVPGVLVNNIPNTSSEVNTYAHFSEPAVLDKTKPDVAVGNIFLDHVEAQHANIPKDSQIFLIEKNTGKSLHGGFIGGTEAMRKDYYTNLSFKECSPAGDYFFRIVKKDMVIAESKPFYYPGSRHFSECKITLSDLEKEMSSKGIAIRSTPALSGYPVVIYGYAKKGIGSVTIKVKDNNGIVVVDGNVKVIANNFTTPPPTIPIRGIVDDKVEPPNYSTWSYTSYKKLPIGTYDVFVSSGNFNVSKKLEVGPPLPSCVIMTNNPLNKWGEAVYKQGEEIVFSWTSKNAEYAVFDRQESDSFLLSFSGNKLPANGSISIKSRIYPGVSTSDMGFLRVYNSTGEGSCRTSINLVGEAKKSISSSNSNIIESPTPQPAVSIASIAFPLVYVSYVNVPSLSCIYVLQASTGQQYDELPPTCINEGQSGSATAKMNRDSPSGQYIVRISDSVSSVDSTPFQLNR